MKRTTVMLPDDLDARLRLEARRRGTSVAELIREAVEARFAGLGPGRPLSFVAVGADAVPDAAARFDELYGEAVEREDAGRRADR